MDDDENAMKIRSRPDRLTSPSRVGPPAENGIGPVVPEEDPPGPDLLPEDDAEVIGNA